MSQMKIPAVFMRGGTSKGLFFHERDLPAGDAARDRFLLSAFGSPDPYGNQLNGMGGGASSLSKTIIVRPSTHPEADIDYLHGQVSVEGPTIDYSGNCGNLSAAVGPFAIDEGLIAPTVRDGEVLVRLHNLNSNTLIHARVPVRDGRFAPDGDFVLPGVAGTSARIALDYRRPGAPDTGALFPTGKLVEQIVIDGQTFTATLAYAPLPMVWVRAEDVGLDATIAPADMDANRPAMRLLDRIRRQGAKRMGLCDTPQNAPLASPKIGIVGAPRDYTALDGQAVRANEADLAVRVVSMGKAHKAIPLTGAMCLAAATLATGSVPAVACIRPVAGPDVRLATPSGVLAVGAELNHERGMLHAERTIVYASARRLMDGFVYGQG
ncbi:MAG TPA: PrpF domain-containing protein [Alphaproteobacteria bacterium]|jgi:2-methylaconitate cis-trans-isomerase PrpF|nr:PrpF domain-containing protein [Alphaproteobacteria bacterium]